MPTGYRNVDTTPLSGGRSFFCNHAILKIVADVYLGPINVGVSEKKKIEVYYISGAIFSNFSVK